MCIAKIEITLRNMKMDNYGLYIILVIILGVSSAILSGILALKSIREENKFQKELAEANRKLADQADETRKLLRGEGYAKFSLGTGSMKKYYLGEKDGYHEFDAMQYHKEGTMITIPEVYPHTMHFVHEFKYKLPIQNPEYFELSYASRSARVIQQIIIRKSIGKCTYAARIWSIELGEKSWNGKIIAEINPRMPNSIPWDKLFIPVDKRVFVQKK